MNVYAWERNNNASHVYVIVGYQYYYTLHYQVQSIKGAEKS